jgi:uncharacterized peroxidase-related enzyme
VSRIHPVQASNVDQQTSDVLKKVKQQWGSSWNMTSSMAHNPAVLEGFLSFFNAIDNSGLNKIDREVICMEMAYSNSCHYCVPAHLYTAHQQGVDKDMIEQIADGGTIEGNSREAVIQRLVRRLEETKGKLSDEEFQAFQDQGVAIPEMIAVIAEIAHCTLTNFFNRLADTDLDPFLEKYRIPN